MADGMINNLQILSGPVLWSSLFFSSVSLSQIIIPEMGWRGGGRGGGVGKNYPVLNSIACGQN